LGAVRDIWILAEKKQKYLWIINLSGAAANVILNAVLIPIWGVNGAAVASLMTQIFTNVVMGWIVRPISPSNRLMLQSLSFKFMASQLKSLKSRKS
jgi:Na+-driven multidrug efflux pump